MSYNRSINALVIGYLLVVILLSVSTALICTGHNLALIPAALTALSLGAAYYHEGAVVACEHHPVRTAAYRVAYRIYRITALAVPALLIAGYAIVAFILIAGA